MYYEEDADDDGEQGVQLYAPRDMHALVDKVNSLEHALAIRDDEQVLLERKVSREPSSFLSTYIQLP